MASAMHGNKVVFAKAGKRCFDADEVRLIAILVFVFEKRDIGKVAGIEPREDLLDIHLGNAVGRAAQRFVCEIESQNFHDFGKVAAD